MLDESPDDVLAEDVTTLNPQVLTIRYEEPCTGKPITEDVFMDPRDSWCASSGGSTLLVCASAVEALQTQLNRQHATSEDSKSVTNQCRRDYLREHQYLIEELKRVVEQITTPGLPPSAEQKELTKTLETKLELSEAAAENVDAVADEEEQQALFDQVYTRHEDDEDLELYLKKSGFKYSVELSFRMAMREIEKALGPLLEQRRRLQAIVAGLEGPGADLIKALTAAIGEDKRANFTTVFKELMDHCLPDQKVALENQITKNLRKRYEDLLELQRKNEDACLRWREKLAGFEERAAVECALDSEVKFAEGELAAKLAREEQDKLERRQEHAAKQREADAEYAKAEAEEEARRANFKKIEAPKEPEPLDPKNFWHKLSREQQNQIRDLEMSCKRGEEEQVMLKNKIATSESEYSARLARQDRLRGEIGDAEQNYDALEKEMAEAENEMTSWGVEERQAKDELRDLERRRNKLEVEQEARSAPPASPMDLTNLENELMEAEMRNEELVEEYEHTKAKEELYNDKVTHARKCLAEMEAANGRIIKPKPEPPKREPKPKPTDPDLLDYHERLDHPKYRDLDRTMTLSMDDRSKEKRVAIHKAALQEKDEQARLACAQPVVHGKGPANVDGSKVPVNFRRQEDLRVKLAAARRDFNHVASAVDQHNQFGAGKRTDMYNMAVSIAEAAAIGRSGHDEARQRFERTFAEARQPRHEEDSVQEEDDPERQNLANALAYHQTCLSEATQAWQLAEHTCERGRAQAELVSERDACAQRDEDFVKAVEKLYQCSARALLVIDARGGGDPLQEPLRRYCREVEESTPGAENAKVAVAAAWEDLFQMALDHEDQRSLQLGLEQLQREKDRSRKLLDAELQAPPEARRALAAVRRALAAGSPLRDALRVEDPLHPGRSSQGAALRSGSASADEAKAPPPDLTLTPRRARGYPAESSTELSSTAVADFQSRAR